MRLPMSMPEGPPQRVVLVGCGAIGELVARRVYATAEPLGCQVVAVVDRVPERARTIGELLAAPAYGSLTEALAAGPVDAADIRLPHDRHAEAVLEALAGNLDVLVEKPVATTAADAQAMLDAARSTGRTVAVAENYPHLAAVRAAAEAIGAGRIGELVAVRTTRAYQLDGIWVRDGWRQGDGPAAGILLDQGTHHTSLLRRLAGPVAAVTAVGTRDTVSLTLRFASGVTGQSLYTWTTPAVPVETEATVFGTAGRIDIPVAYDDGHEPVENYYDSHTAIVADWIGAIRDKRPPVVDLRDAAADLAVVLAAARSLVTGREEKVVASAQP
jgi:predicted dehydrogenase